MRVDNSVFAEQNNRPEKQPHFVVRFSFDKADTDLHYLTSHANTPVPGGASVTTNCVRRLSGSSQRINPDIATSEIGVIGFDVIDKNSEITALIKTKLDAGDGLRNKKVVYYVGYEGMPWVDFQRVHTFLADTPTYKDGVYKFSTADIQRQARKQIFEPKVLYLNGDITATATKIPLSGSDLTIFQTVAHDAKYSVHPSQSVGYIKIGKEVIAHTGMVNDGGLGTIVSVLQRGALGTAAVAHDVDLSKDLDRRTKVTEHIFLEGAAPKVMYAILTGKLEGTQASLPLPTHWHLGISTSLVRLADFENIGVDLWDASDDSGREMRFEGLKKTDGKRFLEKEIGLYISTFMPVYSDGALGLRRLAPVLAGSPAVEALTEKNVVSYGSLKHDYSKVINQIRIEWNWIDAKDEFSKTNVYIDSASISKHDSAPVKNMAFRGVVTGASSEQDLVNQFDALRDRYSGPPITLSIEVMPTLNPLEVGDIVYLSLPQVRDMVTGTTLSRAFEIQRVGVNWQTGRVKLDLFGSSQAAGALSQTTLTNVLADSWYVSTGTDLNSLPEVSGGVVNSDVTLTGHASDNNNAIYYHNGDLEIAPGVTVTINENVFFKIKGTLTLNGKIGGKGLGAAGGTGMSAFVSVPDTWNSTSGVSGGFGLTRSSAGLFFVFPGNSFVPYTFPSQLATVSSGGLFGVPFYQTSVNDTGVAITGLPKNLRGSGGGGGGAVGSINGAGTPTVEANGGNGGAGGAGLLMIARGYAYGLNGSIDVSGNDGIVGATSLGTYFNGHRAGSGGGGSPGGVVAFIDGNASPFALESKLVANLGDSEPIPTFPPSSIISDATIGYYQSLMQGFRSRAMNDAAGRVQYVPARRSIDEQVDVIHQIPALSSITLLSDDTTVLVRDDGTVVTRIKASWTASTDPNGIGYEMQAKLNSEAATEWVTVAMTNDSAVTFLYMESTKGESYDARVRVLADELAITSDWVSSLNKVAAGSPPVIGDVSGFSAVQNGQVVIFKWLPVPNANLNGYEIRYGAQGASNWADATPLTEITKGTNITSAAVVTGSWTFYIKSVDTSGGYSVNATTSNVNFVSDYDVIAQQEESPLWVGTLTNFVLHHTGVLVPKSQNLASADGWETFDQFVINPYTICTYEAAEVDVSFDSTIRAWSVITSALGPGETGAADPQLSIDYKLSAGSYDGFEDWTVGFIDARYIKSKLTLDTSIGNAYVSGFEITADSIERKEKHANQVIAAGGTVITFDQEFHVKPFVSGFTVQGTIALYPTHELLTPTSLKAHMFNSAGSDVGGIGDIEITGV